MTDHQQAAIEAARTSWDAHFFGPTRNEFDEITCAECGYAFGWDGLGKGPRGDRALNHAFDQALAAAEPHLRKKWAEELAARIRAADKDENAVIWVEQENALNGRGGYYVYVADWILEGAGE